MAKDFQTLTIKDSFMFAAVMNELETCRLLLERVLGMQILDVGIVTEKMMSYRPDYHGVRLDALAIENGTKRRFNVEMQVKEPQELVSSLEYVGHPELPTSDEYVKLLTDRVANVKRNRTWEVKYMLFEEMLRDEREEGREEGAQYMILNLLQEYGEVPEDIRLRVMNEKDMHILMKMNQFAARVKSFDDFRSQL